MPDKPTSRAPEQRRMFGQLPAAGGLQDRMRRQVSAFGIGRVETIVTQMRVNEGPPEKLTAGAATGRQ